MSRFEEPPEVQTIPPDRLYCFLNKERPCDASCMAFRVEGRQGVGNCNALLALGRLANFADRAYEIYSNRASDAQRAANAPYAVDPMTGRPV